MSDFKLEMYHFRNNHAHIPTSLKMKILCNFLTIHFFG